MLDRLELYLSWWNGLSRGERDRFFHDLRSKKIDNNRKAEIKALAKHFLHKDHVSWNCSSCLEDAHILIVRLKLEEMENKTIEYVLYPGTILHDPINQNFDLILMPPKLTEGLALYHLTFNLRADKYFVTKPADVDKRIADYLSGLDDEMKAKALPSALEALKKYEAKAEAKPKATKAKKGDAPADAEPAPEAEPEKEPDAPAEQGEA